METKICKRCGIEKETSDFTKNKSKNGGLNNWCKGCTRLYNKIYYQKNAVEAKIYALKNKDKIKIRMHKYGIDYRKKNEEKIKEGKRIYYESYYKEASREINARNGRERRRAGKINKLNKNMSLSIWRSLKYGKNGRHWEDLTGYTLEILKQHLEKQFSDGMAWENYGKNGWEVDHKIPISLFNIDGINSKGFKKAWALENLQPMWQKDNASKRDKLFVA